MFPLVYKLQATDLCLKLGMLALLSFYLGLKQKLMDNYEI